MKKSIMSLIIIVALLISSMQFYNRSSYAGEATSTGVGFDLNGLENRTPLRSPDFVDWVIPRAVSTEYVYDGVTYKISCMGGGNLYGGQNKTLGGTDAGTPYLTMDGILIDDGNISSYIRLEISGLKAGEHSFTSWHSIFNSEQGTTPNTMSIELNGDVVENNLVVPSKVSVDNDAAIAYFKFEARTGENIIIDFKSDGNGMYKFPILNAFEIDGSHPLKSISNIYPENADKHFEPEKGFSWTGAESAVKHDVYLGTEKEAVLNATKNSLEYLATTRECRFDTSKMSLSHTETYYWRVDEVFEDGSVEKGTTNSFTPAHLAFPSAEGYGRYAIGGRGGEIVEVTNLNDSGEGSLRWALEELSGPRIVVFKVGGVIKLNSKIIIKAGHDNVYIAGQTAPGDGITLINYSLGMMGAEDVVVRNVRVRVGDSNGAACDGMGMASSNHCIIDHCSISWSTDEGFSSRGAKNISFQNNIIAEALHESVHYDANNREETENHSFAASISGDIGSIHHNLITNCAGRNFSLAGGWEVDGKKFGGEVDVRNNVFYNFRNRTMDGGVRRLNFVSNYYKMGYESPDMKLLAMDTGVSSVGDVQRAYVAGNMLVDRNNNPLLNYKDDAWTKGYASASNMTLGKSYEAFYSSYVTHESALDAYESVLANVGAIVPKLDYLDSRYIEEVKNGSYTYMGSKAGLKGIIDSQDDVGGYPTDKQFKGGEAEIDSDHDGMPDEWEKAHGLNPNYYEDAKLTNLSADGYTNIEMYLNELMGDELVWANEATEPKVTDAPVIKTTRAPWVKETEKTESSTVPTPTPMPIITDAPVGGANHIAVDMNGNENRANLKSKTFSDWSITSKTLKASKTFGDISIDITTEGGVTQIIGSQNKNLLNKENTHYLSCDGIIVNDAIKLTISGLSAGLHSMSTWHNIFKNEYTTATSIIDIYVNDDLKQTLSATLMLNNDDLVGISNFSFVAEEGKDVCIYLRKSSSSLSDYVVLNAFEIDGENPVERVTDVYPKDNEEYHNPEDGLSWTVGKTAVSHDVYFGTDYEALLTADRSSELYKGNQTETSYPLPDDLTQKYTYYWRIDEIDSEGNITKGFVNGFNVRHLAFPSAIGAGKYSKAGRGGQTIEVTTLDDTGAEGSLRWALECEKGPRIIVFKVSGDFELKSELTIPKDGSNVYLAGQTAANGEVNICNYPLVIDSANDVIIRNIKFSNTSGLFLKGGNNNIIDTCSFVDFKSINVSDESIVSLSNNLFDGTYIGVLDKEIIDTDRDGLSDEWEMAHGLNPLDKMDAREYSLSSEGYTNLEMYLNELMFEDVSWNDYVPSPTVAPLETAVPTNTPMATDVVIPSESTESYSLGDVDMDSDVDANDALLVLKHVAKLSKLDDTAKLAANVNLDETIDATDALMILKYAAKLIRVFR